MEPVSSARDAGSWFVSQRMLAHSLPTAPAKDTPHPNEGNGEIASSARDAENHFVSQRMLAQVVFTTRTLSLHYPIFIPK